MKYSVNYNNNVIELRDYSIEVAEILEKQDKTNSSNIRFREKCTSMYSTLVYLLGDTVVQDIVGDIKSCDPNDINLLYLNIVKAYNKPLNDYNEDSTLENLNSIQVDRLAKLVDSLEKANSLRVNN